MTRCVWFLRHGNKEWDEAPDSIKSLDYPLDSPLSEAGCQQMLEASDALVNQDIHHIVASPFLRTVHSACIVAERLALKVKIDFRLQEQFNEYPDIVGRFSDAYPAGIQAMLDGEYPIIKTLSTSDTDLKPWERAGIEIINIIRSLSGNILFVGHGSTVTGGIWRLLNQTPRSFPSGAPYGSISCLSIGPFEGEMPREEGASTVGVIKHGDIGHLSMPELSTRFMKKRNLNLWMLSQTQKPNLEGLTRILNMENGQNCI